MSLLALAVGLLLVTIAWFSLAHIYTKEGFEEEAKVVNVLPVIFSDGSSQMIPYSGPPPLAWVPGKDEMNMRSIPPWMMPQVAGMGMSLGMGNF